MLRPAEARQVTGASRGKLGESHTEASQEWHVDQSHQRKVQRFSCVSPARAISTGG
jgi:hypothetical protein